MKAKDVAVCDQENLYFENLTVLENLEVFAKLNSNVVTTNRIMQLLINVKL